MERVRGFCGGDAFGTVVAGGKIASRPFRRSESIHIELICLYLFNEFTACENRRKDDTAQEILLTTLHQRIFNDIQAAILDGTWPPGHRIPFETELTEQYQCSRMTVSKALSALAERGMIVRRRRAGTFVATPLNRTVMEIQDIGTQDLLATQLHSYKILANAVSELTAEEAPTVGAPKGAPVKRVQCLHWVDSQAYALEQRIIMLDVVPQARQENFDALPPGQWMITQIPWSEARHVIQALAADANTARLLETKRNTACLKLIRQTFLNQVTINYTEIVYVGDRYQFAGSFISGGQNTEID
jgi:GntR family histidine utilization transcriptional repressor